MRTREELTSCSVDNTMRRTEVSIRAILNNTLWSLPQMGKGDRVAVDEVDVTPSSVQGKIIIKRGRYNAGKYRKSHTGI